MGKPGIPAYGAYFRLEALPYDKYTVSWSSRRYVLRANPQVSIRSLVGSKSWQIFVAGPENASFPYGKFHNTLRDTMPTAIALGEYLKNGA